MVTITDELVSNLKRDEGFRSDIYVDTTRHRTIGYGTKLPLNEEQSDCLDIGQVIHKGGINKEQADCMMRVELKEKAQKIKDKLEKKGIWSKLKQVRKDVMINMCYNLGLFGVLEFTNMISALENGDYKAASHEMLKSKWHEQVGRRAERLARQMRTGSRINYD